MNLLDTASLVVTPNGYKASKLYSIIPSNGTGDMTFARTGDTATRVNSSGLIESVLANKPRLDYTGGGCPKLLLEPQRTNLLTYSNAFDDASWGKSNTTVLANQIASPDGTSNADKLTNSGITADEYIQKTGLQTTAGTYVSSVFVKNIDAVNTTLMAIHISEGSVTSELTYTWATNTFTISGTNGLSGKATSYGNGWVRLEFTYTISTATGHFFRLYAQPGQSTKSLYLYGAQVELGAYATSYIPTTTASVTRNNETLSLSVLPNNDMNFTAILKLADVSQGGTGGDWFQIYYPSAIQGRAYGYSTAIGFADNYNISATFTSNKNLCFKQESGINAKIFTDGVLRATSTSGNYANAFTRFQIQSENLLKPMNINSFIFYNYALTDQECITITSL